MQPSDTLCQGVKGTTFHHRVLTQPPVSSAPLLHTVDARRRLASYSAPPKLHWLCVLVTKERAKLDVFQESKQEVISLKDLGEFFPPSPR